MICRMLRGYAQPLYTIDVLEVIWFRNIYKHMSGMYTVEEHIEPDKSLTIAS